MLRPASVRSLLTNVTASGSRRTYSCTSSLAFCARACIRTLSMSTLPLENFFDLVLSIRLHSGHTCAPASALYSAWSSGRSS